MQNIDKRSINRRWMFVVMAGLLATYQASFVRGTALPIVATNLVVNGSFETGYPGNNFCGAWWHEVGYNCEPSGTIIPGWTETAGGVDWHTVAPEGNPLEPVPQDGSYLIDLKGGDNGRIEQNVPTTEGAIYTLKFAYAIHSVCGDSATGTAAAGTESLSLTPTAMALSTADHNQGTLAFTGAAGATTTISFENLTGSTCGGVVVDNVSVEQTLPASANACKNGGWQSYGIFKNQGDCVSFIATGGRNGAGGSN